MRTVVLAAALLSLTAGAALASPPTAEQKARFLKACEKYGATEVCTCKAEQAGGQLVTRDAPLIKRASERGFGHLLAALP